jgi:hypothetical protein
MRVTTPSGPLLDIGYAPIGLASESPFESEAPRVAQRVIGIAQAWARCR